MFLTRTCTICRTSCIKVASMPNSADIAARLHASRSGVPLIVVRLQS
jgi:hypothetical protein